VSENNAVSFRIKLLVEERIDLQEKIKKQRKDLEELEGEERAISTMVNALQRLVNPNRLRPGRSKQEEQV
jgi:hypothetical protein